jgi:hypothetical protein
MTGEVAGVVTDADDNPVDGVDVTFVESGGGPEETSVTVDGAYLVEVTAGNTYEVTAEASGSDDTDTVTVNQDEKYVVHFTLQDDGGPDISDYTNENGVVDIEGFQQAIDDLIEQKISVSLFVQVLNAFIDGDPVT